MAEKRRSGVAAEPKSAKAESDEEFLSQAGVDALLRGALLKLVEARPEDAIGFLAEHFTNEASETESCGGADGGDGDGGRDREGKCPDALEEQQLNKALWHLSSAHHSQRYGLALTAVSSCICGGLGLSVWKRQVCLFLQSVMGLKTPSKDNKRTMNIRGSGILHYPH